MAKYFKKSLELLDKYDSYMVTGKPDSKGNTPAAGLEVTSRRERNYPNFNFSDPDPNAVYSHLIKRTGWSPQYISAQILNHYDNPLNSTKEFHLESDVEKPTELFTTEPRSATITAAVFDPSLKHTMPTVGAMVHQEHGIPITADESLSRASSKLAKNAQQKGLPVMGHQGNPTFEQNNTVPMTEHYFSNDYEKNEALEGFTEIHPDKVREAKNHLRGLLGREPKDTRNHLSPQFSQTQLPGMENF